MKRGKVSELVRIGHKQNGSRALSWSDPRCDTKSRWGIPMPRFDAILAQRARESAYLRSADVGLEAQEWRSWSMERS